MAIPVGVQLYSVRDDCKNDLPGTLAALAKMGYQGVEWAGYFGGLAAADLRKMLDDLGLKSAGTHTGLQTLQGDELARTVEFNQILGNRYLIVPGLPGDIRKAGPKAWREVAHQLDQAAGKVAYANMRVGYHCHAVDFDRVEGQTVWDTLATTTSRQVVMQLDTGNAVQGGQDAVACLKRYPGRAGTVHLKGINRNPAVKDGWEWTYAGEGNAIVWPEVFDFCKTAGATEWYIVEHEEYPIPPLECVKRCLTSLRKFLVV